MLPCADSDSVVPLCLWWCSSQVPGDSDVLFDARMSSTSKGAAGAKLGNASKTTRLVVGLEARGAYDSLVVTAAKASR